MFIPADSAQVTMTWSTAVTGDVAQCVFGVRNLTDLSALSICYAVIDIWQGNGPSTAYLNEEVVDTFTLTEVAAAIGSVTGQASEVAEQSCSVPGLVDATALPASNTYLLRKGTGLPGAAHRGRMFLPGAYESAVDAAGRLESSVYTSLTTKSGEFLSDLTSYDIPMVLFHATGVTPSDIVTTLNPAPWIGTIRGRLFA